MRYELIHRLFSENNTAMKPEHLWKTIKEQLFANHDPDWLATNIAPLKPWIQDYCFILYAPNIFVSEEVAIVRPDIRGVLPEGLTEVQITIGDPPATKAIKAGPSAGAGEDTRKAAGTDISPRPPQRSVQRSRPTQNIEEGTLSHVWPRDVRAMPADLLRSSLFTINRYGMGAERPRRHKTLLFSMSNFELRATGEETNIFDADVQAQLLHYQRNQPFGTKVWFSLRELCLDLDMHANGENFTRVRESIERLRSTEIELNYKNEDRRIQYRGQLIASFLRIESGQADQWSVEFSKDLIVLLGPGVQARYHLETDRKLSSNLARYLLRFYSTHTNHVYPIKVETMRQFTGTTTSPKHFKSNLKNALNELVAIEEIDSWEIKDDKIYIVRSKPLRLT